MYGHASAPENVTCAVSPRLADAFAANNNCSTAHACRAFGLPRIFSGANPSNAASYAGCTATNCPCRCVESSVISIPQLSTHLQGQLVAVHPRSEEHTSELQSRSDLVCRL